MQQCHVTNNRKSVSREGFFPPAQIDGSPQPSLMGGSTCWPNDGVMSHRWPEPRPGLMRLEFAAGTERGGVLQTT